MKLLQRFLDFYQIYGKFSLDFANIKHDYTLGCQPDEPLASLVTTNRIINAIYGFLVVIMLLISHQHDEYKYLHMKLLQNFWTFTRPRVYKVWWLCLVPTSTTRFTSDVGYRMAKI